MASSSTQIKKAAQKAGFVGSTGTQLFSDLLQSSDRPSSINDTDDGTIIITGGDLFNKGAQAMTFTVVDQMAQRFPKSDLVLLSSPDFERPVSEKQQYSFDILPWGVEQRLSLLSNVASHVQNDHTTAEVKDAFSDCIFMIDISGYALSSQWGTEKSFSYLSNIVLARKHSIPVYILPQSIGPFQYKSKEKLLLNPFMNFYLPYPEVICPREREGTQALSPYTIHNVQQEFDLVLHNDNYTIDNIFIDPPDLVSYEIDAESVGIVPNMKVYDRMESSEFYKMYENILDTLDNIGKNAYILPHSEKDMELCTKIYNKNEANRDVHVINKELTAIELESVIEQFDFIVGSRYHSLIHSFKNDVPVVAIGWATKYQELLSTFEQSDFHFECRKSIDHTELTDAVERLSTTHVDESSNIKQKRLQITDDNLFERLF